MMSAACGHRAEVEMISERQCAVRCATAASAGAHDVDGDGFQAGWARSRSASSSAQSRQDEHL
eukprot:425109-Pleurochrysis_carterae.AAC.2